VAVRRWSRRPITATTSNAVTINAPAIIQVAAWLSISRTHTKHELPGWGRMRSYATGSSRPDPRCASRPAEFPTRPAEFTSTTAELTSATAEFSFAPGGVIALDTPAALPSVPRRAPGGSGVSEAGLGSAPVAYTSLPAIRLRPLRRTNR
jgi:hypothetical protein